MSTDRELLEYARQALQNENSLRLGYTTRKGGPIESIAKDAIERIDAALAAPAAGLSWSGHNISGDAESIRVVKDALHDAGNVPVLKDEIARLRAAPPAVVHADFDRLWAPYKKGTDAEKEAIARAWYYEGRLDGGPPQRTSEPLSDEMIERVHQETGLLGGGQEWVHRFAREMFKRGQATTPATALPVAWRWSASHSKAPDDRAWKEGPPPAAHESRLETAYAPGSVAWRSMDSAWAGPRGFATEATPVERGTGTTIDHQTEAEHKLAVELGFTPGAHDATILMLNAAVRIRRLRSGGAPKEGA